MIQTILARYWPHFALGLFAILGVIAFKVWLADVKHDARQEGVTTERAGQLTETLNSVEKANDTRRQIDDPASRARYDECLRSARTPANCQRFLPQ